MLANLSQFLGNEAVQTIAMCLLACLSVAIVMRFFVKRILSSVEKYLNTKHEPTDKVVVVYETVKAFIYSAVGFVLTAFVLFELFKVCKFPADNNPALAFFYFIPMYALQFFFDKNMKRIALKAFCLDNEESSGTDDDLTKESKPKKAKVHYKKVAYTIDDEGNEVVVND